MEADKSIMRFILRAADFRTRSREQFLPGPRCVRDVLDDEAAGHALAERQTRVQCLGAESPTPVGRWRLPR